MQYLSRKRWRKIFCQVLDAHSAHESACAPLRISALIYISLFFLRHLFIEVSRYHFGGNFMAIRFFSDRVRVLSIGLKSDPGFVNRVRSGPGFVNPIRSDPVQVLLTPIEMWFFMVCTLIGNEYGSLLFSQTFFSNCFCKLSEFAKVFERKVLRVQSAHLYKYAAHALSNCQEKAFLFLFLDIVVKSKSNVV